MCVECPTRWFARRGVSSWPRQLSRNPPPLSPPCLPRLVRSAAATPTSCVPPLSSLRARSSSRRADPLRLPSLLLLINPLNPPDPAPRLCCPLFTSPPLLLATRARNSNGQRTSRPPSSTPSSSAPWVRLLPPPFSAPPPPSQQGTDQMRTPRPRHGPHGPRGAQAVLWVQARREAADDLPA